MSNDEPKEEIKAQMSPPCRCKFNFPLVTLLLGKRRRKIDAGEAYIC
jgi:hypothetical protein